MEGTSINLLLYADDLLLFSSTIIKLQLDLLYDYCTWTVNKPSAGTRLLTIDPKPEK